jgi:hypothetical protein
MANQCGPGGVYSSSMKNAYPIELIVRTSLESVPARGNLKVSATSPALRTHEQAEVPLHLLKRRLLLDALEQTPDAGLCKRLCGAANQAADLAWETVAPALAFPVFFEHLVRSIREQRS